MAALRVNLRRTRTDYKGAAFKALLLSSLVIGPGTSDCASSTCLCALATAS